MEQYETIIILYVAFIWLILLHTFEEISQDIFGIRVGHITLTKKKYLLGASCISTVNLLTLVLLLYRNPFGLYTGIFTSSIFGISQIIVHTIGFIKEGGKPKKFGAGFFSSIPLAAAASVLLYNILKVI